MAYASHLKALPLIHRSYKLMRQTKYLPLASVVPIPPDLCRLSSVPAGRWPFPTLSLQSLHGCLDPYPAVFLRCTYPFLPEELRPHVRSETFGTPNCLCNATSTEHAMSGLQSFRYVQALMFARPPGCTHRCNSKVSGRPGRLHHAMNIRLPVRTVASLHA